MIVDAVSLILGQLNQYIHQQDGDPHGAPDAVIVGNIANADHPVFSSDVENQVVLTLVNLEEEAALKNGPTFTRAGPDAVSYHNPAIHLNLFVLFTANYRNYDTALRRLSQIVTFFQGKQRFTLRNSPGTVASVSVISDLSISMDLLSLSFEEVNHLWGSLGGKQGPFVAYRGRLVTVRDLRVLEGGGPVLEVEVTGHDATP